MSLVDAIAIIGGSAVGGGLLAVPAGKNLESRDSISILMAPAACLAAWRATLLVTRYPPAKSTSASPICRSTLSMEAVAPSTRHSLTPRF